MTRLIRLEDFAYVLGIITSMVFNKDFDVRVCVDYVSAVTNSIGVVSDYFAHWVQYRAKLFDVEAQKADLRVI